MGKVINWLLGWCPYCKKFHWFRIGIKRRKLNTAYQEKERNYMTSCLPAYKETFEYYKERWEDYYSGLL